MRFQSQAGYILYVYGVVPKCVFLYVYIQKSIQLCHFADLSIDPNCIVCLDYVF